MPRHVLETFPPVLGKSLRKCFFLLSVIVLANIVDYACGDTIRGDITITKEYSDWISLGELNNCKGTKVWLFNNHISRIIQDSLTPMLFDSLKSTISQTYNLEPYYTRDSLYSGLEMPVEHYYWLDTISGDCISLLRSTENNPDSLISLWFENYKILSNYQDSILGPDEDYEFTIIDDID